MKTAIEYIKEAWGIYTKKENFIFFAKIMAVITIVTTSLSYAFNYFYPVTTLENLDYSNTPMLITFIIFSALGFFVSLWSQTTTYYAIFRKTESEKEVFRAGLVNMFKFFLVSLVVGLILVLGVVLLVVPAIIFGVWYSFSILLVLDKGMGIGQALKQSKSIVSGRFWKILGRSVVFGLFSFLIAIIFSMVPYVGSMFVLFLSPLTLLPFYLLYEDLTFGHGDLSASSGL